MKRLFIFYMMSATMIFSAHVHQDISTESRVQELTDDLGDDTFFDEMSLEPVVIEKKDPSGLDYVKVAGLACYHYCIQKPFNAVKYYISRLRVLVLQRKKDDKKYIKTSF